MTMARAFHAVRPSYPRRRPLSTEFGSAYPAGIVGGGAASAATCQESRRGPMRVTFGGMPSGPRYPKWYAKKSQTHIDLEHLFFYNRSATA